jgi:uncharacterized membrane protein
VNFLVFLLKAVGVSIACALIIYWIGISLGDSSDLVSIRAIFVAIGVFVASLIRYWRSVKK